MKFGDRRERERERERKKKKDRLGIYFLLFATRFNFYVSFSVANKNRYCIYVLQWCLFFIQCNSMEMVCVCVCVCVCACACVRVRACLHITFSNICFL